MDRIDEIISYIEEEMERESETIKDEPANSHLKSMGHGAYDAYARLIEFINDMDNT